MSFFDRMKDSVTLAGVGASKKVSCTADTIKLNNSIRDNEKEIEKLTYQVGVKCVEQHLRDENSEYEELFSQIRRYRAENEAHRAEIRRLADDYEEQMQKHQQEMRERQEQREQERIQKEELKQKQAEIERQQESKRQQEIQRKLDESTRICRQCNQRNELDARFCVYCGKPMLSEEPIAVLQENFEETNEEGV